jgi:hypothetical protein
MNGKKTDEQGVITVEILHLNHYQKRSQGGQTVVSTNWSKYPLEIRRPLVGRTTINHFCQICREPLSIKVYSKSYLTRIIRVAGIVLGISLALFAFAAANYQPTMGLSFMDTVLLASLSLAPLSAIPLVITLNLEYRKKGIGDHICKASYVGGTLLNTHGIDQSPQP